MTVQNSAPPVIGTLDEESIRVGAAAFCETFDKVRSEVSTFIVGHEDIIEKTLIAIICGGHVLLEGLPGLGKTAMVHSVAEALELSFARVQFTPDLLPADVLGTNIIVENEHGKRGFEFQKGPVFTNILLADEINRATPKTQSALLEVMQEKSVTVAGSTHKLDLPFFVLATQNPIEMDGTYPLPEAQLDRFFFKLLVGTPTHDEYAKILTRTASNDTPQLSPVAHGEDILRMGMLAREVPVAGEVLDYLIRIIRATNPQDEIASKTVQRFVRYGGSPRATQAILLAARAKALLSGRFHVAREDIKSCAPDALRHRILLSFEGEAEGVETDIIIDELLEICG